MSLQLGMLGLGRMGAGMVRRMMKAGVRCVVYDVNPDAVKALEAEGAVGAETAAGSAAPVNIATLDEHLRKYKGLKEEEEANRATVRRLVEQAEGIVPTLSDPDRLTLQNLLDDTCDRMNQGRYSIEIILA